MELRQAQLFSGLSDRRGRWRVRLKQGFYFYFLHHPSLGWAEGILEVRSDGSHLDRTLSPFALHSGRVVDSGGQPISPPRAEAHLSIDPPSEGENATAFYKEVFPSFYPPMAQNILRPDGSFEVSWMPLDGFKGSLRLERHSVFAASPVKKILLDSQGFQDRNLVLPLSTK